MEGLMFVIAIVLAGIVFTLLVTNSELGRIADAAAVHHVGDGTLADRPIGRVAAIDERVRFLTRATAHLSTVRARHFEGLTIDLARAEGAHVLVRAAHKETADELSMAAMNVTRPVSPVV